MEKQINIFAENIEGQALDQFYTAMKMPFAVAGALMADAHTGYALPIGAVVAAKDVVVPAWVGYDIGCGMCAVPTTYAPEDIQDRAADIVKAVKSVIPVGFSHHKLPQPWSEYETYEKSSWLKGYFEERGFQQLGTLGGGNHFIEFGMDESAQVWIVIHSGSRGIGHAVGKQYMETAASMNSTKRTEWHNPLDASLAEGFAYRKDAHFCQEFALANRMSMLRNIEEAINPLIPGHLWYTKLINRNHNHVEYSDELGGVWIHRKGATHAEEGMAGVIPGNMRDGSFIVRGLGNPDSLWSSSHGAGRVLGRKAAKRELAVGDFEEAMRGIVADVNEHTLDESPMAYKNIFEVMKLQKALVKVTAYIKPIINIKG